MKNIIVITGGAGFVGSNLIEFFVKRTNFKILSIDNYSSGSKKNHILSKKVKYVDAHTKDIHKILNVYKGRIKSIFHFGEFSRIFQSFLHMDECIKSNTIGTVAVFNFCLKNKIKLIKYYDDHNIFVLPSFTEGHPMVLLEALARRRPVVIFDEIKHVIGDKKGIFVTKRNFLSFLGTLNNIKKNYKKIQKDMKKNKLPTNKEFIDKFIRLIDDFD